jgi:hypothetical protein
MIFEDTKDLLQKTEEVVLNVDKSKKRWINIADRIINYNTIGLIFVGGPYFWVKRIIAIMVILWMSVTIVSLFNKNCTAENFISNGGIALICAVILAPFVLPSKSFADDVKNEYIKEILEEIKIKKFSVSQLHIVKDNLEILKTEFESKVSMSRWIITVLWAVFLYLFVQYFVPPAIEGNSIKLQNVQLTFIGLTFIGFFYFIERCFFRAGKKIFLILNLALNEALAEKE